MSKLLRKLPIEWKSPIGDIGQNALAKLLDLLVRKSRVLADVVHCRKPMFCEQSLDTLREYF
jgi:hypothetical protein